jgi:hypothetical protein
MAENWKTPLIDIVDERIHFVYVARRQAAPDSALASYTVGYEEWDVMERDWRGRPTVCSAPVSSVLHSGRSSFAWNSGVDETIQE